MRKFTILLISVAAFAQQSAPPKKPTKVDFTASIRARGEFNEWFDKTDQGQYGFGATIIRFGMGQKFSRVDWFLEGAQPTLFALPSDAVLPAPRGQSGLGASYFAANGRENVAGIFLKQGFLRFKGLGAGNNLRLGRFEFIDGSETKPADPTVASLKADRINHRLIGNFGFSHVGRSFDGVEFVHGSKTNNVTLFAGRATQGVFTVHGMNGIDVDVQYASWTHQFTSNKNAPADLRGFFLEYHDGRRVLKTDNRSAAARALDTGKIRIHTFGAHYVQAFKARRATFDLLGWGALQFGNWGALDHRAGAFAMEAGVQPTGMKWLRPWVRGGLNWSSGDNNAADGRHGTFFQALPTPRIYARHPFYTQMNLRDTFLSLTLRPAGRVTLRYDYRHLALAEAADLWYAGGGAFEPRSFGFAGRPAGGSTDLGRLFDLSIDIPMGKQATLSGYYAHAFAGRVIRNIYGPRAASDYGYVELNWRFP